MFANVDPGTLSAAVIFTGLVVVFTALVGLFFVVWLIGKLFVAIENSRKPGGGKQADVTSVVSAPQAPAAAPARNTPAVAADGIDDEVVAVIAAAVAAMDDGAGYVLRSVRRAREARPAWAQAGLMQNTQPFFTGIGQ